MKKIIAVIPVRKGSQRVKAKNTRPFSNTTLLDLKISVLKNLKGLDSILVTTDCDICETIAKKHNVNLHRRDEFYAGSEITNDKHWKNIASITPGDFVFMAQTTSPMVKLSTYQAAIDKIREDIKIDSIVSTTIEKKFLWENNKPLNYNLDQTPKSQDLPDIFSLNFAVSIIDKKIMMEKGNVVGNNPYFLPLNKVEAVDVDDMIDFEFAEYLYIKYGNEWLYD